MPHADFTRYADLQRYVGWIPSDAERMAAARRLVEPQIPALIEDFYAEIERHPRAAAVITGGKEQVERLKTTLRAWIAELLAGPYDADYVARRSRVGLRHVEIGLEQVYTNLALARLRCGITTVVCQQWRGEQREMIATVLSLHKLLDLDLAVITTAYEAEHVRREQAQVRGKLEGVLHQQREFSEGLLAYAQAVVLVLDLQGRIVRLNPFIERLAGVSTSEAEGQEWLTLLIPEADRVRARRELYDRLLEGPAAPGLATTGLRAVGDASRSIRWSSTLLRDAAGQPFAILVIGQDITDVAAAQQRALQAERLAAIGQMATGLAHEARNALQRIQASAEMLELELRRQPEALAYIRRIEHAQSHLQKLFDEVRGYAAPVQLDRSRSRLASLWREAWDLLTPQRNGRQATLRELPGNVDFEANVDRFRLLQVFRNILENALAACSDPVEIAIACERTGTAALRITISDNGPGLSPEQRRRIFEPFFTTKPTGTGLGMAIAHRWIEAHGGSIEIGTPAHGAEIIITLPVID